jgi:group I intron endonuclease
MLVFKLSETKLPKTNGIYAIVHSESGKIYIGSAAGKLGFYERFNGHRKALRNKKHHSSYFQRSYYKYGVDAFEIWILEECEPEKCLPWEQYYLDTWEPEYNSCKIAGTSLGCKQSEETKKKISKIRSKSYFLVSPEGVVFQGNNRLKFCKEKGLHRSHINKVLLGESLHSLGWTNSLEKHNLYLDYFHFRGINYRKQDGWRVPVTKNRQTKAYRFKTKEEAIAFRDNYEKDNNYTFMVISRGWKEKLNKL